MLQDLQLAENYTSEYLWAVNKKEKVVMPSKKSRLSMIDSRAKMMLLLLLMRKAAPGFHFLPSQLGEM